MAKTYQGLKELLYHFSHVEMNLTIEFLEKMDDSEFANIPVILFTPETKRVIETYGCIINVSRKNDKTELESHKVYCIYPSIFKIIT